MLPRIFRIFWPGFIDHKEVLKFFILSACAFFMIGAQWPLKALKDGLLISEMGADNQPIMRILSVFSCFIVSLGYGQLVNFFRREVVLYLLVAFLTIFGLVFYALLSMYPLGMLPFDKSYVIQSFYLYSDVFQVLTIPTFWAFVNDITTPDEARLSYGFITFAAQVGALVTVLIGRQMSVSSCSSPNISLLSTFFLIVFALLIAFLIKKVGKDSLRGYVADKKKIGEKHSIPFLKGLGLILTSPYVSGLLFLTIAPDVLMSVVSFKWMKILESSFVFDKTKMITFIFDYNLIIQIVSCFFSLISSFFYNNFGVKKCIVFYPVCIFILVLLIMFFPSLLVATGSLAFMKGLHYALNKPAREKLYIPTTKEVKYKSKAWIEVFGTRIFKATGASINKLPISFSSGFLIIMPFVWAAIASVVGSKYEESVKGNETVV